MKTKNKRKKSFTTKNTSKKSKSIIISNDNRIIASAIINAINDINKLEDIILSELLNDDDKHIIVNTVYNYYEITKKNIPHVLQQAHNTSVLVNIMCDYETNKVIFYEEMNEQIKHDINVAEEILDRIKPYIATEDFNEVEILINCEKYKV